MSDEFLLICKRMRELLQQIVAYNVFREYGYDPLKLRNQLLRICAQEKFTDEQEEYFLPLQHMMQIGPLNNENVLEVQSVLKKNVEEIKRICSKGVSSLAEKALSATLNMVEHTEALMIRLVREILSESGNLDLNGAINLGFSEFSDQILLDLQEMQRLYNAFTRVNFTQSKRSQKIYYEFVGEFKFEKYCFSDSQVTK